jgi:DNA invertase Pin-like site-specific DNA recombinase
MTADKELDIVQLVLAACQAEGFDAGVADLIERRICEEYGGRTIYVRKKNRLSEDAKRQVIAEGLTSKSTRQITSERGISRATLYRLMKRAGI